MSHNELDSAIYQLGFFVLVCVLGSIVGASRDVAADRYKKEDAAEREDEADTDTTRAFVV